jgi:uncharacterized protein (DUF427 family)
MKLPSLIGIYMGMMAKAMWDGAVLAESDATVEIEGNQYLDEAAGAADAIACSGAGVCVG